MRTYRELFRTPEFGPFFFAASLQGAAKTVSGLALGVLIFEATESPLLSALAMFGPSFGQVLGATVLLSAADRLPPRAAMTALALTFGIATCLQAIPGVPVWGSLAIVLTIGVLASLDGGVRWGLLNEIVPGPGYLLGRSVFNMSNGVVQICGFAVGGVLVTVLSPRGTLLVGAAFYLGAAAAARLGLSGRPSRASGRPSAGETWRNNVRLFSSRPRRYVYLALWLPNGLVVGCESLFVPYSPQHAGLLLAFAALGMLAGDVVFGRFVPRGWRERLGMPLRLLLAAPFLVFALRPPLAFVVAAVTLATVGYAATLLLQERLMSLTPDELSGHALGLHSSGMLTMQGVGAALAGGIAQVISPAVTITAMAALSVVVTVVLEPGLRSGRSSRQEPSADTDSLVCAGAEVR